MSTDRVGGIDHVSLPMQHTEAMLTFYRALGFDITEQKAIVSMHAGRQMINFHRPELWPREGFTLRAPAAVPPCGDLCFVWDGSVASLRALLEATGAEIEEGPVERVGGRRETATSVYVRDPDGNLLEFITYETTAQRPEGAERGVDQ
jgi:catechol 2,3-dioxygenase-like lactoylglutathione lyase family enzyme